MGVLSDAKVLADWLGKLFGWWKVRQDPIRAQAQRVLDVFAAHGVAQTQISRLLPEQFAIPMKDFASADKLTGHLTPAFLDWVAEYFVLSRSWLDGLPVDPHQTICCYKHPADFAAWLAERQTEEPFQFRLFVLKPSAKPINPNSNENIVIVLEECITYLDDQSVCRYFIIDGNGPLNHYPVIRSLMGLCVVADRMRCLVKGRVVEEKICTAIEDGLLLIPLGLSKARNSWEPDGMLFQLPANDLPWQKQLRADIAEDLSSVMGANCQRASTDE